jgi:hypothetical protein
MANPFFSNATRYPITLKPVTSPDNKATHTDIFNLLNTFRSLLRDMDSLFLGHTLYTAAPNDADWTDTGVGGVAFSDGTEQAIHAAAASVGTNLILRTRPLASSAPFTVTAAVQSQFPIKDNLGAGICLRDDTTGAFLVIGVIGANLTVAVYSDEITAPTILQAIPFTPLSPQWYRIVDDATDTDLQYSVDGTSWITVHSLASNAAYTEAGFWVSNENTTSPDLAISARLFSWRVE